MAIVLDSVVADGRIKSITNIKIASNVVVGPNYNLTINNLRSSYADGAGLEIITSQDFMFGVTNTTSYHNYPFSVNPNLTIFIVNSNFYIIVTTNPPTIKVKLLAVLQFSLKELNTHQ